MDADAAARASRAFSFFDGRPLEVFPEVATSETNSMASRDAMPIGRAERIAGGRSSIFGICGAAAKPLPRLRIGIGSVTGNLEVVRAATIADGKTFILNKQ